MTHAVHCPKCNRILPPKEFIYTISRQHALARGYSGERRVEFTSNFCKACRPPTERKLSKLTIHELNALVESGDIGPATAVRVQENKVKRKSKACSKASKQRWDSPRKNEWDTWVSYVRHEMDLIKRQKRYAQKIDDPNTVAFCDSAIFMLHGMIGRLKTREFLKEKLAPDENPLQWPEPERSDAAKLWANIVPSITKPPRTPIFL